MAIIYKTVNRDETTGKLSFTTQSKPNDFVMPTSAYRDLKSESYANFPAYVKYDDASDEVSDRSVKLPIPNLEITENKATYRTKLPYDIHLETPLKDSNTITITNKSHLDKFGFTHWDENKNFVKDDIYDFHIVSSKNDDGSLNIDENSDERLKNFYISNSNRKGYNFATGEVLSTEEHEKETGEYLIHSKHLIDEDPEKNTDAITHDDDFLGGDVKPLVITGFHPKTNQPIFEQLSGKKFDVRDYRATGSSLNNPDRVAVIVQSSDEKNHDFVNLSAHINYNKEGEYFINRHAFAEYTDRDDNKRIASRVYDFLKGNQMFIKLPDEVSKHFKENDFRWNDIQANDILKKRLYYVDANLKDSFIAKRMEHVTHSNLYKSRVAANELKEVDKPDDGFGGNPEATHMPVDTYKINPTQKFELFNHHSIIIPTGGTFHIVDRHSELERKSAKPYAISEDSANDTWNLIPMSNGEKSQSISNRFLHKHNTYILPSAKDVSDVLFERSDNSLVKGVSSNVDSTIYDRPFNEVANNTHEEFKDKRALSSWNNPIKFHIDNGGVMKPVAVSFVGDAFGPASQKEDGETLKML